MTGLRAVPVMLDTGPRDVDVELDLVVADEVNVLHPTVLERPPYLIRSKMALGQNVIGSKCHWFKNAIGSKMALGQNGIGSKMPLLGQKCHRFKNGNGSKMALGQKCHWFKNATGSKMP